MAVKLLKVFFDTSVIFADKSAADLASRESVRLIKEFANPSRVQIKWCLPKMVVDERRYQMLTFAKEFLPAYQKIAKLLSAERDNMAKTLESKIDEAIKRQISELGLEIQTISANEMNLQQLIDDSVARKPPFEEGDTEKGFRDAIVLETFFQAHSNSQSSRHDQLFIFVTADGRQYDAAQSRASSVNNVQIVKSLADLRTTVNVIMGRESEKFIEQIQEHAMRYFLTPNDINSVFHKERVAERIKQKYPREFEAILPGMFRRVNEPTWNIGPPSFQKREGKRFVWVSQITIKARGYQYTIKPTYYPPSGSTVTGFSPPTGLRYSAPTAYSVPEPRQPPVPLGTGYSAPVGGSRLLPPSDSDIYAIDGETTFEVIWSVEISDNEEFSSPKIEDIRNLGTVWT